MSGAAVSLFRHGDGQPRLPHARRDHGADPAESFEPAATLATIEAEKCDVLYGVPTMFIAQLNHPEFGRYALSSLRRGIMAGAPCPVEVMKEVMSKMHMSEITIAYGTDRDQSGELPKRSRRPTGSSSLTVGRVQPHLEVKIIDGEGPNRSTGEPGELCTRGYSVMLGYWGDEARTKEAARRRGLDAYGPTSPPSTTMATAESSVASRTW